MLADEGSGGVLGRLDRDPYIMSVTPVRQDRDMRNRVMAPIPQIGDIVGAHACPVCEGAVQQVFRPGRIRIYCGNACRQRAYRWRRANGIRCVVERDGPAERLLNDRRHALRDHRDPVSRLRDRRGREVAVCGTFARPVRDARVTHDRFVPEHPWSCEACVRLIGVGPPGSGIPDVVARYAVGLVRRQAASA